MSKTISIDALRKTKKGAQTIPRPAVEDHGCKSPDAFVILLDEKEQSAPSSPESTSDAVPHNRAKHQRY
jgi:hypothetical protein